MSKVKMRNTVANGGMTGVDDNINRIFAYKQGKNYSQVKKRVKARASNTESQIAVRKEFTQSSQGWSQLNEDQRIAYNEVAPLFQGTDQFGTTTPSGKNVYTGCNIALLSAGLPSTVNANAPVTTLQIQGSGLENDTLNIVGVVTTPSTKDRLQLRVSKPVSAGTFASQKCKILQNYTCASAVPLNLATDILDKYPTFSEGQKMSYEIYIISEYGYRKLIGKDTFQYAP